MWPHTPGTCGITHQERVASHTRNVWPHTPGTCRLTHQERNMWPHTPGTERVASHTRNGTCGLTHQEHVASHTRNVWPHTLGTCGLTQQERVASHTRNMCLTHQERVASHTRNMWPHTPGTCGLTRQEHVASHTRNMWPDRCFQCACSSYVRRLSSPLPRYTANRPFSLTSLMSASLHYLKMTPTAQLHSRRYIHDRHSKTLNNSYIALVITWPSG